MIHQGLIVLLCNDTHLVDAGIHHVGQGKVHQAVAPAIGNRSHYSVLGELTHPLFMYIGKQNADYVIAAHHFATSSASIIALGGTVEPAGSLQPGPITATPQSSLFSISSGR